MYRDLQAHVAEVESEAVPTRASIALRSRDARKDDGTTSRICALPVIDAM